MQIAPIYPKIANSIRFGTLNKHQERLIEDVKSGDQEALDKVTTMVAETKARLSQPSQPDPNAGIVTDIFTTFERAMANKFAQVPTAKDLDKEVEALRNNAEYSPSLTAVPFVALVNRLKELLHPEPSKDI